MEKNVKKRKKIILTGILIFAASWMLTGCSLQNEPGQIAEESALQRNETVSQTEETVPQTEEAALHPEQIESVSTGCYVYTTLDGETQRVYDEIYQTVMSQEEAIRVSTLDPDVLDEAYKAVTADYGGFFWVSGYVYTQYTKDEEPIGIDFAPKYTMTRQEREELQAQIDGKVAEILSGISMDASDYQKTRYVFDYLASNVDYVPDAPDNQNIVSVFLNQKTVCQGYASATQYLLARLGIQTAIVTGEANGAAHAWNLVRMDGEYYYVDTTWGNSTYASTGTGMERFINYNYFGVTTQEISMTHVPNDYFVLPVCNAVEDNYYVRENRFFSEWNPDAVGALCREGYERGNTDRKSVV